jgi:hypothetical protein
MNRRMNNCQYRNKLCSIFLVVAFLFWVCLCFRFRFCLWSCPCFLVVILRRRRRTCFCFCFLLVILRRRRRTCFSSSLAKIPEEGPLTQCAPLGQQAQSPELASAKRIVCAISTGAGRPSLNSTSATSPGPCPSGEPERSPTIEEVRLQGEHDLFIASGRAAHGASGRLNVFLSRIQTIE